MIRKKEIAEQIRKELEEDEPELQLNLLGVKQNNLLSRHFFMCLLPVLVALSVAALPQTSSAAETKEPPVLELVSPIGAVVRSAVLPGWGQMHANSYFSGGFSLISTMGFLAGGLVAHRSYQQVYRDEYMPVATSNPKSTQALSIYGRVNQVYKVRQFFLLAAVGVWAYSLVDSYVESNIHNAKSKSYQLNQDADIIEKMSFQLKPNRISLEFKF